MKLILRGSYPWASLLYLVQDVSGILYGPAQLHFSTVWQLSVLDILSSLPLDGLYALFGSFRVLDYIYVVDIFSLFWSWLEIVELDDVYVLWVGFSEIRGVAFMIILLLLLFHWVIVSLLLDRVWINVEVLIFDLGDVVDIFLRIFLFI